MLCGLAKRHATSCELIDGGPSVHRVTAKPVDLDDDPVVLLDTVDQLRKRWALEGWYRARYRFGHETAWHNAKSTFSRSSRWIVRQAGGCDLIERFAHRCHQRQARDRLF